MKTKRSIQLSVHKGNLKLLKIFCDYKAYFGLKK